MTTSKTTLMAITAVGAAGLVLALARGEELLPATANGVTLSANYKTWQMLSVSHRTDKHSLRGILGNDIAVQAVREGRRSPWPDGAQLVKVVWKERVHGKWAEAIVPGELEHVEVMVKDANKFAATGGWGFGRWIGSRLQPIQKTDFADECFACHTAVKDSDFVFTEVPELP